MIIRIAITALATAFLGAAAYAVVPEKPQSASVVPAPINTTFIKKNQSWPLRGNISLDPCQKVHCKSA